VIDPRPNVQEAFALCAWKNFAAESEASAIVTLAEYIQVTFKTATFSWRTKAILLTILFQNFDTAFITAISESLLGK
jgi:hypothetical protein